MIYKLNNKYYVKVSGYLIEVIPVIKDGELDFNTTQNKIEITSGLAYKSISINEIRDELENTKKESPKLGEDLEIKKSNERTHNKFKFGYKD